MIQNQYYYLVAGLPELAFDAEHKKADLVSQRDYIRENLESQDALLLDALFLGYDNENVLRFVNKKEGYSNLGTVPAAAYEDYAENIALFPSYIQEFVKAITSEDSQPSTEESEVSLEVNLLNRFYSYASKLDNEFIVRWFCFDRQLRNILAATNARKLGKEVAPYLVGHDEFHEALTKSLTPDFGLRSDIPFMDKLMQAIDTADIIERERKFDMLRWDFIDEQNTFSYFNVDKVLGFMIKAMIIDRWSKIDSKVGEELLKKYSGDL